MSVTLKFIPQRKTDLITYGKQVHEVITAQGFIPDSMGLTTADVTELGAALTGAQDAMDAANAARMDARAKTQTLSAPNGKVEQLRGKLRSIANAVRISDAPDDVIATIGVSRRQPTPSTRSAPTVAPEFTVDSVIPGGVNVRFRAAGSSQPRARAANAIGVQIAAVSGTTPTVAGEADSAPNQFISRSPGTLDSASMPDKVRLYARWITARGDTGPWTLPQEVAVI
jgi:hypothetical protein